MKSRWIIASTALLVAALLVWTMLARERTARSRAPEAAPAAAPQANASEGTPALEPAEQTEQRIAIDASPAPTPEPAAASESAPLSPRECEIRGRFVLPGGAPAANVAFEVDGWGSNDETVQKYGLPDDWADLNGTSDADGHVSIRFEPPRAYQFTFEAKTPGYAGAEWRWGEILAGAVVDLGEVELVRGGTVEGRIVNADGKPVLGGDWTVYARSVGLSEGDGRDETQVMTDADPTTGHFRVEDVMPGRVELSAYYRSSTPSTVIQVKSGETVEADIATVSREESHRITLEATSKRLRALSPEAEHVSITGPDGVPRTPKATRFSFGTFVFDDLAPGEYTLSIDDPRFRPWSRTAHPGAQVEAELVGASALEVIVHDADGSLLDSCDLEIQLRNVNFSPHGFEYPGAATLLTAGVVDGLTSGDYRITARGNEQLGSVDIDGLAPGERRKVEVLVSAETFVSGRVRFSDGEAASGAEVALLPAVSPNAQRSAFEASMSVADRVLFEQGVEKVESDASGAFRFIIVRPGQYVVHAGTSSGSVASEPLELGPGKGRDGLELVLPRGGEVTGRIVAPPGASCAGLRLWIGSQQAIGRMSMREAIHELDAGGRFDFEGIPPGANSVYLLLPLQKQRTGHGSLSWSGGLTNDVELGAVEVIDGGRVERDFEVPQFPGTVVIDVRVNGEIVAGVSLELSMQKGEESFAVFGETDAKGRFGPALAFPGSWTLQARDSHAGWRYSHPSPLLVSANHESTAIVEISVSAAALVFLDATNGSPLAARFISLLGPTPDEFEFPWQRRKTDAQGRASFTLASGEYRLRLDESDELPFPGDLGADSAQAPAKKERITPLVWAVGGPLTREIRL